MRLAAAALGVWAGLASAAQAQTIVLPEGMPPQIIPGTLDPGTPRFSVVGGGTLFDSAAPPTVPSGDGTLALGNWTGGLGGGTGAGLGSTAGPGTDAVLAQLQGQTYGQTAIDTATKLGVSPAASAAFARAESDFRNVAAENGSTTAFGPWQITSGTWDTMVKRYGLPYTAADRTNPEASAVVAQYTIAAYAGATSQALGRPANGVEAYGSYVFGPGVGGQLAAAAPSTPLSSIIPASSLSNNGMTGWSVQNWQDFASRRLGEAATQPVLTGKT